MLEKDQVKKYLREYQGHFLRDVYNHFKSKINFSYLSKRENQIAILKSSKNNIISTTRFVLLLTLYICSKLIQKSSRFRITPKILKNKLDQPLSSFYKKSLSYLDPKRESTISKIDLIEMSIRNMQAKKTRTLVTIGGMTIGIAVIVFLVSIGYGLQKLVVTRVARLDEMKQADISPQAASNIKITDKTISNFLKISNVEKVLPLISVVGRVNFKNSISDMAVYGVTSDYIKQSAIKPIRGKIFDNNSIKVSMTKKSVGEVAGVYIEKTSGTYLETIQDVDISIDPSSWIRVREEPSTTSPIIGYTKRTEGTPHAEEIWGFQYLSENNAGSAGESDSGTKLGKWLKASVLLWKEEACDIKTQGDCEEGKYIIMRDESNKQLQKEGYFAEINISILNALKIKDTNVLGVTSDSSSLTALEDSEIDWVDISSESASAKTVENKKVKLLDQAQKVAIVNRAMLKILGIKENEAIGKKFSTSFIVVGDLLSDQNEKIESVPAEYTIIGLVPDDRTPFFYVPFVDLRGLGIDNYSQIKLVSNDQNVLPKIRKQVEAMGFSTKSVADTVSQINSLFSTARTLLGLIGMIALAIASLGMFNTLTVSLLERTREVGLMKAMGMKSSEIQELFLTESMIMGFFGGILGIILGFIAGKLLGLFLSFISIVKGVGFINISSIPISFIFIVILLSLTVGLVTGIYPAKRAKKISALNALRYE